MILAPSKPHPYFSFFFLTHSRNRAFQNDSNKNETLPPQVEARLRQLEGRALATDGAKPRGKAQPTKYGNGNGAISANGAASHDAAGDATPAPEKKEKKDKKDKK